MFPTKIAIIPLQKILPLVLLLFLLIRPTSGNMLALLTDEQLEKTDRSILAKHATATNPTNEYLQTCLNPEINNDEEDKTCQATPINKRSVFPAQQPLVCLAFLSCCGRTDLLQQTMNAVVRHMEEDEPSIIKQHYEIAWVDNGSPPDKQLSIQESFQIDHALPMPRNMGLAWGMNALLFDLCQAPYILLLEEDWLYMDSKVAEPTIERQHAIANALALLEANVKDPTTQRPIKGVFLRTESNIVPTRSGVLKDATLSVDNNSLAYTNPSLPYRISCMQFQQTGHIFGAFTNGAGLYDRKSLTQQVGRMYGEPGDIFSDLSVEGNYCFRVGLQFCAARLVMEPSAAECDFDTNKNVPPTCAAVFNHIGGGRGTRPARRKHMKCVDDAWNFYGTPYFDQVPKQECSKTLPNIWEQLKLNAEFQKMNDLHNQAVFAKESEQRKLMLQIADALEPLSSQPEQFRRIYSQDPQYAQYAQMTDEEIRNFPTKLRNLATSPHQLPGFWDILGRPVGVDFDVP